MKKISIILYAVLFLAVIGSYALHFTGKKTGNAASGESATIAGVPADGIAYVNIDTIIFKFDMFQDRRNDLLDKQQKAEVELNAKGSRYERDARDFQDKVSKGLVTRATAAEMEQALMQQQQEFINLRDQLQASLMEEEQVMNRQVIDYITKFLEENKSNYNYSYVLGKSFGSVVLYGDSSLDVTGMVVEGLNKKYQAEKK
ncbi:MAG: OmpH family outer membrane protein [Bacteroidales bacterium]|jgi:outer membrane protein|nr:OmpH family outer membrane protein [Bacteroidales bacterium]